MRTRRQKTRIILFIAPVIGILAVLAWLFWNLPPLDSISQNLAVPSIRIVDRNGRALYDVLDQEGGRHIPVPLGSIPEDLKQATIATEDQNFYENPGVDLFGILRAFWINLRGGETLAGGSTITQQVARNLLLSEEEQFERSYRRKLRESWLAWRLSRKYTKDEVLGLYLNQMYYGGLAYGVEAAAQTYFGKSVSELSLAESALIAGIPQGPAIYNPLIDPEAAQNRQHIVLELMLKQGKITQEQYDLAIREPLHFTPSPYPIQAPHFVMMVQAQLDELIPPETRDPQQSIIVHTTLDLNWQQLAEKAIAKHLQALAGTDLTGKGHNVPGGHNVNNAALVAIDPKTGEILALVGSPDYFDADNAGAINMALAPRQPGSALKPIVYAAALDPTRQDPMTAATMILDVRTTFTIGEDQAYTPANFDNQEHGPVSTRQALASSLNIPAVITLNRVGLQDVFDLASQMGITTFGNPEDYDLSLALGGGAVRLLELATAYGTFANTGYRLTPFSISAITTQDGKNLFQHQNPTTVRVLDERVAWLISDILNDNDARSLGFGRSSTLKIDRPAAVKTGTTTNFHDNWTIGFTPDLVVGVWVGNASYEPMRAVTGLSGAGPIWHQFIREALTGTPETWFTRPDGMVQVEVCGLSGMLPSTACPYTKLEWFIRGTEPTQTDTVFQRILIDSTTGLLANQNTPLERRTQITALDLPPQAHPWARSQGITLLSDLQPSGMTANWAEYPLQIVTPGNHDIFHLNPNLNIEAQRLHIEAVNATGVIQVTLWLDGELLATLNSPPFEAWWPLEVGEHSLWAEGQMLNGEPLKSPVVTFQVEAQ